MFGKKQSVTIEDQLKVLADYGINMNDGVNEEDLLSFDSRETIEKTPYKGLVEVLGLDLERDPYTPICNTLWMCDYERIEDHGDYSTIIKRLILMTGNVLRINDIKDYVDIEEQKAWVEFKYDGKIVHWDAKVDDDWLDPSIIVKYDALLKVAGIDIRIYSNYSDYGQVAFLAAFTKAQKKRFVKRSPIKLKLIEKQA